MSERVKGASFQMEAEFLFPNLGGDWLSHRPMFDPTAF